ncbi:MAG TPA: NAD(P)/FAD-dependent oxidoreductase [Solirubrobacteraceae bacterium]|nr:NAD(P)/FAD-dependent oxidoreductase [Solirubrobacteraceae bacterium]
MSASEYDVAIIGGGFAGVTAARECALRGHRVILLEARDRLGGRTWSADWDGHRIEYGGAWVHWHQPHTFSEITRAGLATTIGVDAQHAIWHVGDERRTGTITERDAIAEKGWDQFVDGVREALPAPHSPLAAIDKLAAFDRLTIAERLAALTLSDEERDVLCAELESLAHAPITDAGAVSVLRWHALSGFSLALTQETGGRVTIDDGTGALLHAIADTAPFERRLAAPVRAIAHDAGRVEIHMSDGGDVRAHVAIVAVPINALSAIAFDPVLPEDKQAAIALGQASRGIKIMLRVRGERVMHNAIRPGHPFGYLDSKGLEADGTQLLIGFGPDAENCDATDLAAVQRQLDAIMPGYELLDATAHDWLADEFSQGTWAIHRPGWYEHHHAAMRRAEPGLIFAGSDLANGWAGFIDGAIESGVRAGALAHAVL